MSKRTLVTYGTDGFRDFVNLPDGRSFNLGSLSVLNLVAGLARSVKEARRSLDTFLEKRESTLAVDLDGLFTLLEPKRARWAGIENPLIEPSGKDFEMLSLINTRLASLRENAAMGSEKTAAIDVDMLEELEVYLDNEPRLQAQRRKVLKEILASEMDAKTLQGAWYDWVQAGAKAYVKEFDADPKSFSSDLIMHLAGKLANQTAKSLKNGEFAHLKSANEIDILDETAKTASEEEALVNEGIAHAVLAKVETTLKVLSASSNKHASLGKADLHRISSELTSLLDAKDLSDPTVRASLLDLTKKADHVLAFFAG